MKISTDRTIISRSIASIRRRGANLDKDIWTCAVSCVAHAQEHGDLSLFADLCSAMPKGSRVATLKAWAATFAPIAFAGEKAKIDKTRVRDGEFQSDRSDWDIDGMMGSPWYEYKKGTEMSEFGLDQLRTYLEKVAEGKETKTRTYSDSASGAASLMLQLLDKLSEPAIATQISEEEEETRKAA